MLGVKKIQKRFRTNRWDGLQSLIDKYRVTCALFTRGPFNKGTRALYNSLCFLWASIALVEEDENEFLRQLNMIKKEEEYELKSFVLALYYSSKHQKEQAMECYQKFLKCKPQSQDVKLIMESMFEKDGGVQRQSYVDVLHNFKNPAIIKLFKANDMI